MCELLSCGSTCKHMTGMIIHKPYVQVCKFTHALQVVYEEGMGSMPAAKLVVAELGLVTAAETDLELGPGPANKPVAPGPLSVKPSSEGSADREDISSR